MTETTSGETPDNILFDLYEKYIGEPETETDVYVGFGLFFAGVAFAAVALVSFVVGVSVYGYRGESGYFSVAQVSYSFALVSAPVTMLSVVVLLPVERRAVYGALAGAVVAVGATAAFVVSYPAQWAEAGAGRMLVVIGAYGVGVSVVLAATAAALIAHQIERAGAPHPSEFDVEAEDEDEEDISMERIEKDIEEAMSEVDLNLGGVKKSDNKKLRFKDDFEGHEMKGGGPRKTTRKAGSGVDAQVEGLRQMKVGGSKTETSTSTVDNQAAALSDLKKQKQDDELPDVAKEDDSVVSWLLGKVGVN